MNVYFVLKFSSGSRDLKREGERSKSKSNFKAIMIVFCDILGIFHIDWVPEGQTINQVCYKEVLTILCEGVRRKYLKCGRMAHGFFTMTTRRHITHCLLRRFWRSTSSLCWNMHPTHLTSPHVTFFISKVQVCIKRNLFRMRRCSEGKGDRGNEEAIRKRPAALLPTVENSHLGIAEEITLKVMTFPLCVNNRL
jgi:ribosomal protein L39E